jgi:hypothetical protein
VLPNDVAPNQEVTFKFDVRPLSCRFAAPSPLRFRMLSQTYGTYTDVTVCNSMNDGTDSDTNAAAYADCACAVVLGRQQVSANIVATSSRCRPARRYRGELTFTWPCLAESRSLLFRERIRRGFCDLRQRIAVGMMKGFALAADHHDKTRVADSLKYSKLCAGMEGPYREPAQRNLEVLKNEFEVE